MSIQDLGEFLEDRAGEDPKWVECPECGGDGDILSVSDDEWITCPTCRGDGQIPNPDLLP